MEEQAEHVYLSGFGGLDPEREAGHSADRPLLLSATAAHIGIPQEYDYLTRRFGPMGRHWTLDVRSLGLNANGRTVDSFRLTLEDGSKQDVHFDVTSFFTMTQQGADHSQI